MIPIEESDAGGADPEVGVITRDSVSEPKRFAVMLHNDHYTTMEFVVEILCEDFRKSKDEAMNVMLKVHSEGRAVAGMYSHDIAETKVMRVTEKARKAGFPLKLTIEPANESGSDSEGRNHDR